MGLAPTPGVGNRAAAANIAQQIVTIRVRDESHTLAPFNLPLKEDLILAKATGGMSMESLLGDETHIGLRSIKILWWLARRAAGEWQLTLDRAWEEWPEDLDIENDLDVEIGEPGVEDLHPEA